MSGSYDPLPPASLTDVHSMMPSAAGRVGLRKVLPFHLIGQIALLADLVIVMMASFAAGIGYQWLFLGNTGNVERFFGIGLIVFANFSAITAARGNYQPTNLINFRKQARDVTLTWAFVALMLLSVAFSLKIAETFSRGSTIALFVIGWLAVLTWRGLMAQFLAHTLENGAFAERNVALIAERGELNSSRVLGELRRCGYQSVKTFEINEAEAAAFGVPSSLRATLDRVIDFSRREPIDALFLLVKWDHPRLIDDILSILRVLPLPIHLVPDGNVARFLASPLRNVGATWTAELKRAPLSVAEQACKRCFDVVAAGFGVLLLCPLLLTTALLIKLDSKGPVFFTQTRNGFNGRSFRIFKFRSMGVLEDGPKIRQATRNDPRVTRVGRWLRRTSIDELPQLFNVLGGSMSLVGPRPHAAAHNTEYEKLVANYAFRYHMKPGITGWAQVNGLRGETSSVDLMERRVELDLWYVNNWTFWLDVRILWKTFLLGVRQPSAY